jgi:LmbE family N-acetylglucosaminyl deacetylase
VSVVTRIKDFGREAVARAFVRTLRKRCQPLPPIDGVLLVVSPHPDDETLGCGGLIARQAAAGRRVHVLFLTDGEASHREHPTLKPSALAALRRDEAVAALQALGVANPRSAATFLGAPDGGLANLDPESRDALVGILRKWIRADQPEAVAVTMKADGSSEHAAAAEMVEAAVRANGGGWLLEFPVWAWWNALRFREQLATANTALFGLEDEALRQRKRAALACHATQVAPTPPWGKPVLPPAISRGCLAPVEFYFRRRVA